MRSIHLSIPKFQLVSDDDGYDGDDDDDDDDDDDEKVEETKKKKKMSSDTSIVICMFTGIYIALKKIVDWVSNDNSQSKGINVVVGNLKDVIDTMNVNRVSLACYARAAICPNREMIPYVTLQNTPAVFINESNMKENINLNIRAGVDATKRTIIVLESHLFSISVFFRIYEILKNIPSNNIYLSGSSAISSAKLSIFYLLSEYTSVFYPWRHHRCDPYITRLSPPAPTAIQLYNPSQPNISLPFLLSPTDSSTLIPIAEEPKIQTSTVMIKQLCINVSNYPFNINEGEKLCDFISKVKKDLDLDDDTVVLTDDFKLMMKNNLSVESVTFEVNQPVLNTAGMLDSIKRLSVKSISGLCNGTDKVMVPNVRNSLVNIFYTLDSQLNNNNYNMQFNKIFPITKFITFIGNQRLCPMRDLLFVTTTFRCLNNPNITNTLSHLATSRLVIVKLNI